MAMTELRRVSKISVLCFLAHLTWADACNAQSYDETVRFLIIGSKQDTTREFGIPITLMNKTTVVSTNESDCTVEFTARAYGTDVSTALMFGGPAMLGSKLGQSGSNNDSASQSAKETYIEQSMKLHFSAMSNWKYEENLVGNIPTNFLVTFDGNGQPILEGTVRVAVMGAIQENQQSCATSCQISVPADTDMDRYEKALAHLYETYCSSEESAF
jgi:hypothetical protein